MDARLRWAGVHNNAIQHAGATEATRSKERNELVRRHSTTLSFSVIRLVRPVHSSVTALANNRSQKLQ